MIRVSEIDFTPSEELSAFQNRVSNTGAIVSFTGIVRDDGNTESLTLTHYPDFTETQIDVFVTEAELKWGLKGSVIVHRVGKMLVGDPIVFVATAAAHRRDAFEACNFLMDKLKSEAPFWKQETCAGETRWIEPKSQDKEDLKRWNDARN